ncbi:MAG: PD-(D/E)XK nuclease family protein [Candidatus Heimdallarchaeota archaeon]
MVLEYELNLSATEFLYFLDCPQKFRLYRILNPLPNKDDFMNSRRSLSSYEMRGYQGKKDDGIKYHHFFEKFHKKYAKVIHQTVPPEEISEDSIKLLYWINQQEKYIAAKDDCYWYPVEREVRLMTEKKRGQIDCIEFCEDKFGLRLIDYKPNPEPNDQLLLLFYATLYNEYQLENPNKDGLNYEVLEVGCYYYEMGIKEIFDLIEVNKKTFDSFFKEILEKIANNKFFIKKSSCWNCNYKYACNIEQRRS